MRQRTGLFRGCRAALILATLLTIVPSANAQRLAEAPWWERSIEASSEYYWIKSDLPRPKVQGIARHLDRMYEEYSRRTY